MSEGTLFNPGFLGSSFLWWVGQIADDSTWRDNTSPGIHKNKNSIPGWGRRYKVRIIGLHDQGETSIPSDQLPWAQIMYPVTAGGGQTNSGQTANLRQGMMVFGFFLDGQDQQVPVIMGVLGNNEQTALSTKIGNNRVTNETPGSLATSGYAEGQEPKSRETKEKVPDKGKEVEKPTSAEQARECAAPPAGVQLNRNGLRPDLPLSRSQFQDQQSARTTADARGLTGTARDDFIQQAVAAGIRNRCAAANSPGSPTVPGATIEGNTSVHKMNAAHVKMEDKLREKIPLMKPDDKVGSALKSIQTVIDNITQKIDKYMKAINSYIEAVSNTLSNIQGLIASAASEISKYMKVVFDKIMEYVLKLLNKTLTRVVAAMPSSLRHLFGDMKEILTELILCLYGRITGALGGMIEGLLTRAINPDELQRRAEQQARQVGAASTSPLASPSVPICYAEDLVADAIFANKDAINDANNAIVDNVNAFLDDIQGQLAGISGSLSDITASIGNISGSISAALSFDNLKLNAFGCELSPNKAVSDFYTFARGGAAAPDNQAPSVENVGESVANRVPPGAPSATEVPFATPPANTPPVTSDRRTPEQIAAATGGLA